MTNPNDQAESPVAAEIIEITNSMLAGFTAMSDGLQERLTALMGAAHLHGIKDGLEAAAHLMSVLAEHAEQDSLKKLISDIVGSLRLMSLSIGEDTATFDGGPKTDGDDADA